MKKQDLFRAWGRILTGRKPVLSIEITKECPLSCPGCYAYQPEHVSGVPLRSLSDLRGEELIQGVLEMVQQRRPLLVYIVGGEPLVRFRELSVLLPRLSDQKIEIRLVTSAVRPIPQEWSAIDRLELSVSVDGLQPDHDQRRSPATYDRILRHIQGHRVGIHCTITRRMMVSRDDYLEEFLRFWGAQPEVRFIRMSFFTPQVGEQSSEILSAELREKAVAQLEQLRHRYPVLQMGSSLLKTFLTPPKNPGECLFARVTHCVSSDLRAEIQPCQFGGNPDCLQCGCLASIGLHSVAHHRLPGGVSIGSIFEVSQRIGRTLEGVRTAVGGVPAGSSGYRLRS